MPIYLSEYIGSGKAGDLFRPRGSDQPGWADIDLRPDGGATRDGHGLNRCLLYLPTPDPDARLYQLASEKGENLPLLVRAGLALRLNATIAYTRLDDLIAELLLRPPGNAWKPLRDRADRQLAIYLGGLLSPSPALRTLAAKIYSETWSTGNSASLTSDLTWVEDFGTNWELSGNRARLEGNGSFNVVHADHQTDTDDQIVSATLATFTRDAAGQVVCSLLGRMSDIDNIYQVQANISPTWTIKALEKWVAGAGTTLATTSSTTNPGDVLRLTMVDSSIEGAIGGTLLGPVTDTAISGVRYAGMSGYSDHAANRIEVDGWSVRDYAQAAPFTVRQSTLRGGDVLRGVEPAGGGLSATVNQASETDTAQPITVNPKRRLVGQAVETDLAQAVTRRKLKALGQPSETDLAQALAKLKRKALIQSTETDTAQALAKLKRKMLGQSTETDLAQALTRKKARILGQSTETDTAQALAQLKRKVLGQPAETDTAQALTRVKATRLGQAVETDLAQPITRAGVAYPVGQAVETDLAQAVTVNPRRRLVGQAVENDTAQTVARLKRKALGPASEADSAQPMTARKLRILNLAAETELAQPLTTRKLRGVAFAVETDLAQPLISSKAKTLGLTVETDLAQPITHVVVLVGYIRIVNLSGRLSTGRQITGRLPSAVDLIGSLPGAVVLAAKLPTADGVTGSLPTAETITGVL